MKKRFILLGLSALSLTTLALIGPPYDDSKPPELPLPAAYPLAVAALGSTTNQYYCVGAGITTDFGAPRWSFTFYTTNKLQKIMTVDFEGKVQEDNGFRW